MLFQWPKIQLQKLGPAQSMLQVTSSEKRTKITLQTHIRTFEIFHFSDNITVVNRGIKSQVHNGYFNDLSVYFKHILIIEPTCSHF